MEQIGMIKFQVMWEIIGWSSRKAASLACLTNVQPAIFIGNIYNCIVVGRAFGLSNVFFNICVVDIDLIRIIKLFWETAFFQLRKLIAVFKSSYVTLRAQQRGTGDSVHVPQHIRCVLIQTSHCVPNSAAALASVGFPTELVSEEWTVFEVNYGLYIPLLLRNIHNLHMTSN